MAIRIADWQNFGKIVAMFFVLPRNYRLAMFASMSDKIDDLSTLAERAMEAFNRLPPDENGFQVTMHGLAKRHGIDPSTFHRVVHGQRKRPEAETVEKIAEALGTTYDWLRFGRGDPPPDLGPSRSQATNISNVRTVELTDRYASRAQVIEMARGQGVKPHILRALALEALESEEDPGRAYWIERLAALIRDERMLAKEIKHFMVLDGEDPTKPDL